jgi:hypothetical protein
LYHQKNLKKERKKSSHIIPDISTQAAIDAAKEKKIWFYVHI